MKYFDAYQKFSAGVQIFVPENEGDYALGKATSGFGVIRYPEGSGYYGDVYFDGKNYEKLGFGIQNFMNSVLNTVSEARGIRRAFYIGQYDYRVTGWIYGNGVMYYVDKDNHPSFFCKGFYSGCEKIGAYKGQFDDTELSDGYLPDMEADITFSLWEGVLEDQMLAKANVKTLENLFIGDSYFELWERKEYAGTLFYDSLANSTNLNIGIGGTKFCDWMPFLPTVETLSQPKRIFLNLGFNDIHTFGNAQRPYEDYTAFLEKLKAIFPESQYYLLNVVQSPSSLMHAKAEEQFNAMTAASAQNMGITVVDMRSVIQSAGGVTEAFHQDGIHLNAKGYAAFTQKIKAIL